MNKQELANKIWTSANKLRSSMDASEYKNYILGFMFYKFLSEKEVAYIQTLGMSNDDMVESLNEESEDLVGDIQKHIGYFISLNLFLYL